MAPLPRTKSLSKILGIVSLFACAHGLFAARSRPQAESVLRATLANGLRVVIVRNPLAPVVTTVMNYSVGSDETPKGFPGSAHAQEHMMFRGSPGLSADQLANITAAMGGMFDADTQQTITQYFFTVPAEDLDVALHIEAIRMRGVLDSDKLWAEERGAIEQEVGQDLSNPQYVLYTKLLSALFDGTPYGHDALGTRPSFDKTTGAMLKQFHDTWYVPNNAVLVIVGDVKPQEALREVRGLFGEIPSGKLPARPHFGFELVRPQELNLDTDLPYGMAVMAFRMPGSNSPDFAAAQVLADVLSSERGNLWDLVPEGKALFTDFSLNVLPRASLGFALAGFPKDGHGGPLAAEVRKVLEGYLQNGFPAGLVQAARRRELAQAEFQKNSVSGLAMAWSQALAVEGRQSPEDDIRAIQKVKVEDVNRVAREYLKFDHAVQAVLTPRSSGKPISSKSFGGKESFAPPQTKPVKLPDWAQKALQRLAIPKSAVDPAVSTLPNGLKLIVQPESVSKTVSVTGHIKNNHYLETRKGKEGVGLVLDQLFSYGSTSLGRKAFQKELDSIAADESAGADFSVQVLSSHFGRGVQLLADNLLHPALPEKAFEVVRKQVAGTVAGQIESPGYLASRAMSIALLPKNDLALRQTTPATVSSLTLSDVRKHYQRVFRPDLTTIVVIGDTTPKQARAVIEKYFGSWKASGPKPETVLPPVPPNVPSATAVPDTDRVQDRVALSETLKLTRSNPDYYALVLGNHVLGGAFYATRLYRDLREHAGLVYYVSSSFDVGKKRSFYEVDYACDPPNVSKARAIVVQNLEEMQSKPVSPEELRQAKALALREIPLAESSLGSIADGLIARSANDLPLDEPVRAAKHYAGMTAGEISAAFAKWLRPGDLAQVTEGPAPQ